MGAPGRLARVKSLSPEELRIKDVVLVGQYALQVAFDLWILFVVSSTVAEALQFETWKGLSTVAITVAVPVVIAIAAALALRG